MIRLGDDVPWLSELLSYPVRPIRPFKSNMNRP